MHNKKSSDVKTVIYMTFYLRRLLVEFDLLQNMILRNRLNRLSYGDDINSHKEVVDTSNLSFEEFFSNCLQNKMRRLSYKFSLTYSFYGEVDDSLVKETEELYERAQKVLKPNRRSIDVFIDYIEKELGAKEYIPDDFEIKMFKSNLMSSIYNHLLDPFDRRMHHNTIDDVLDYTINTVNYKLKKYYPDETFELDMRFYKVKDNSMSKNGREVLIRIEVLTENISVRNCNREIARELMNFLGLSEIDIKEKSTRFMQYVLWLRDKGEL